MSKGELGRFLRDRREGISPGEIGLPADPRRRTPGLRREEVAALASMSVEYYVRLEQGRGPRPSVRILCALAAALRLEPTERLHLFRLAGVVPEPPADPPHRVRPHVTALLRRLPEAAVVVTAADYDVIAFNPLADALLGGLSERPNLARRRFVQRDLVLTEGHEDFGEIAAARLRAAADRYPRDASLAALLAELRTTSEEFREIWSANRVRVAGHRTKVMTHPELGPLRIDCDVLSVPEDDQQVVFMTADPGGSTARALRHLAASIVR